MVGVISSSQKALLPVKVPEVKVTAPSLSICTLELPAVKVPTLVNNVPEVPFKFKTRELLSVVKVPPEPMFRLAISLELTLRVTVCAFISTVSPA